MFADDAKGFWAVADGLGGHEGGEVASAAVIDSLAEISANPRTLEGAVRAAIMGVHRNIHERNRAAGVGPGMGTTVAVLGVSGAGYFCLWAGDSRVCRLRGTELTRLTRDHRYVQELVDAGALTSEQAASHPQRNTITRAVGTDRALSLDRVGGEARKEDRFILMTDGVSDLCTDAEIAARMRLSDPEKGADDLLALCLSRGAPDNVSFVIVHPR
ncbi:MAG: serine/threonine-protein phosphatase [Alphaproteobacteria bacterium]|nr:serine/threonine-protein phosphatase [Alphaproteobacteria bacterium]